MLIQHNMFHRHQIGCDDCRVSTSVVQFISSILYLIFGLLRKVLNVVTFHNDHILGQC